MWGLVTPACQHLCQIRRSPNIENTSYVCLTRQHESRNGEHTPDMWYTPISTRHTWFTHTHTHATISTCSHFHTSDGVCLSVIVYVTLNASVCGCLHHFFGGEWWVVCVSGGSKVTGAAWVVKFSQCTCVLGTNHFKVYCYGAHA